MFVDQADIQVFAGDGGNGCVSFRKEKYIALGGPDGGDGGAGGSVYLQATPGVDTLLDMVGRHHWYAERGAHGMGKKMAGKDGLDLVIRVPPGTLIYDADSKILLADLKEPGKKVRLVKGGKGGKGNINYTTSVRQAPDFAQPGGRGEVRNLHLELRLIADVGLVGLPNAGKSTLLSRLSAARPKIADYPFTTLVPQLGIAELDAERRLVIADIPGIIEGAHEGHGLGIDFLRHIERTRVVVHMIDILPMDESKPIDVYHQIRKELAAYSPKLAAKAELLVANKMDLTGASEALADLRDALPGKQIFAISAVAGTGLRPLLEAIYAQVQRAPKSEPFIDPPPHVLPPSFMPLPEDAEVEPEKPAKIYVMPVAQKAAEPEDNNKHPAKKKLLARRVIEPKGTSKKIGGKHAKKVAARKLAAKTTVLKNTGPKAKPSSSRAKVTTKAQPPLEIDAELAAEIAAIKADDLRKSKYYKRLKTDK